MINLMKLEFSYLAEEFNNKKMTVQVPAAETHGELLVNLIEVLQLYFGWSEDYFVADLCTAFAELITEGKDEVESFDFSSPEDRFWLKLIR